MVSPDTFWTKLVGLVYEVPQSQWVRHTTLVRTAMEAWLSRRRNLYLTIQNPQDTDIHASGGIRNRSCSMRAALDLHPRPSDHSDWPQSMDTNNYSMSVRAVFFYVRRGSAYLKREGVTKLYVTQERSCNFRFCYFPPPPFCRFWTAISKPVGWIKDLTRVGPKDLTRVGPKASDVTNFLRWKK